MSLFGLLFVLVLALGKEVPVFLAERGIYKMHDFFDWRVSSLALSLVDVLALVFFALGAQTYILKTFKKTVSPEIFFFAFWLAAQSFDALRLLHILLASAGASDSVLALLAKAYTGVNFFGYIVLFVSGLYAAGMRNERQFSIVAVCAGISVALAMALPINTGIWAQNGMFQIGYGRLVEGFSLAIVLITVANYLIAARAREDRAYYYVTLGIAAVAAGSRFLRQDGSPLLSLLALVTMLMGGVLYIHKLHAFYLWQ